jgi:asparagine synthase (glutamine-hydrolysing)
VYVVLAWFTDRSVTSGLAEAGLERFATAAAPLIPASYLHHQLGGDDWGVRVQYAPPGAFRWPVVATGDRVTAVSLGLPVGIDTSGGPVGLARRLLAGGDVHADVVPPFSLIAVDGADRFAIQQDWLGMGRLFTASAHGITAFCNRPSLLAAFLWGVREPDVEGWRSYTATGHFGGDRSPLRGVRLMRPGERFNGQRHPDGGWSVTSVIRRSVDDLVAEGVAAQAHGVDAAVELATEGLVATAKSAYDLYTDDITIGLSGGKDSRVIAAAFLATGRPIGFMTNVDTPAEGDTAQELMRILREKRGLDPPHRLFRAGTPADVLKVGLHERVVRLQNLYDFQFPSSYVARQAAARQLPSTRSASISGVGGELAVAYWYPDDPSGDLDRDVARQTAIQRLNSAVPAGAMDVDAYAEECARVAAVADRADALGLQGQAITDYVYLVERVRRWYSSAYLFGVFTPFLSPTFVAASFALTAAQKRRWALHHGVLDRFLPEWSGVPFITGVTAGESTAAAVWDGDGVRAISDLLDTASGPLTATIRPAAVREALENCVAGAPASRRRPSLLRQFAYLAVATHTLRPDAVRDIEPTTYRRLTMPRRPASRPVLRPSSKPVPVLVRLAARRLPFVRRTRLGRRVWSAVRDRLS